MSNEPMTDERLLDDHAKLLAFIGATSGDSARDEIRRLREDNKHLRASCEQREHQVRVADRECRKLRKVVEAAKQNIDAINKRDINKMALTYIELRDSLRDLEKKR